MPASRLAPTKSSSRLNRKASSLAVAHERPSACFLPLVPDPDRPILGQAAQVPSETFLEPSPEQDAIIAARRADPGGSLRVVAFAGSGKTTALRLLTEADATPALYIAYNKSTQLAAQGRFPAHVACRTVLSLAYRATGIFD